MSQYSANGHDTGNCKTFNFNIGGNSDFGKSKMVNIHNRNV